MFKPRYEQLINLDSSLSMCVKSGLSLQHNCFVCVFSPSHFFLTKLLKGDTDMVRSYYHAVSYLQCCYALLAMSNAAHNYWKCYINVVTRMCSAFYWYIRNLPRACSALRIMCIYQSNPSLPCYNIMKDLTWNLSLPPSLIYFCICAWQVYIYIARYNQIIKTVSNHT